MVTPSSIASCKRGVRGHGLQDGFFDDAILAYLMYPNLLYHLTLFGLTSLIGNTHFPSVPRLFKSLRV
jgi:hypothetical protein